MLLNKIRFSQEGRLPPEGLYYDTDFKSVMKLFKTDPTTGLVANEVKDRLERYGKNKLPGTFFVLLLMP